MAAAAAAASEMLGRAAAISAALEAEEHLRQIQAGLRDQEEQANDAVKVLKRKEKKSKDHAFRCQFNEKPSIILGCPGRYALLVLVTGLLLSMAGCGQNDNSSCRNALVTTVISILCFWEDEHVFYGLICTLMLTNRPFGWLNVAARVDLIGTWVLLQPTDWCWDN